MSKSKLYTSYFISSLIAFIIDISLFNIFFILLNDIITDAIILSSFLARAISSVINYIVNKYIVFKYKTQNSKKDISILKYFSLVIFNVTISAFLVDILHLILPICVTIIKIIIDILIFISNFFIQKKLIFKSQDYTLKK